MRSVFAWIGAGRDGFGNATFVRPPSSNNHPGSSKVTMNAVIECGLTTSVGDSHTEPFFRGPRAASLKALTAASASLNRCACGDAMPCLCP